MWAKSPIFLPTLAPNFGLKIPMKKPTTMWRFCQGDRDILNTSESETNINQRVYASLEFISYTHDSHKIQEFFPWLLLSATPLTTF